MAVKRRRIAPIPVDESAEAANPLPAVAIVTRHVNNSEVPPPEAGRRMWVSLADGYDFNYRKLLQQKGARLADPFRQREQGAHGRSTHADGTSGDREAASQEHGNQMLNAIQRIERRVQRERMVAVTGKDAVDSDEENAEPAADGDDLEGAVQEEDDNNDKDEEGEEDNEETYQSTKGPKDQYDLNDDFIDDSEFIEAIEMRDERKLKHQGFFVNSGSVERVGEKVEIIAHARQKVQRSTTRQPTKGKASAGSKAKAQAAAKSAEPADPSPGMPSLSPVPPGDPQPPDSQQPSPAQASAAPKPPSSSPSQPLSIAQQAMLMGANSAFDPARPALPAGGPATDAAARSQPAAPSPQAAAMRSRQLLSSSPPAPVTSQQAAGGPEASNDLAPSTRAASMDTSAGGAADADGCQPPATAAAPAADTAADPQSRPSTGGGSGGRLDMDEHAKEMLALPVDIPEGDCVALPGWHPIPEFRRVLVELQLEAARTPPPDDPAPAQGSKKKMPSKLAAKLDLLTRPFYLSAEAATSVNRAKRLLWAVLLPFLTTWSAEPTIKTKMQKINSHIIGQYTLAKERFEAIAIWHVSAGVDSINHPDVSSAIRRFVDCKSRHDAVPLDSTRADELLWDAAAHAWEAACGKAISGEILRTLADRATGAPG